MSQNINVQNNTGTINIYNGPEEGKEKKASVSIPAIDKYSSPLNAKIEVSSIGKDMYRVSFLLENELISQVIEQNYLTFKKEASANDMYDRIVEMIGSIKKETLEKMLHSAVVVPMIRNKMNVFEKESQIAQPESKDLLIRTKHEGDIEAVPAGLVIHPVNDHFPEHNGTVKIASKGKHANWYQVASLEWQKKTKQEKDEIIKEKQKTFYKDDFKNAWDSMLGEHIDATDTGVIAYKRHEMVQDYMDAFVGTEYKTCRDHQGCKADSNNWYKMAQTDEPVKPMGLNIPISSGLVQILSQLKSQGCMSLIVGGAVRDAVMGISPKDIDIEVYNTNYENLVQILEQLGKVNLVGRAFGIVKLTDAEGNEYDFSVPRRDNKIGNGHKDFAVTFDADIQPKDAAARRDFTVNSMAYDPLEKKLYDYYNGYQDIQNKVLKATSEAFAEDPLRVLRGMQFAARFGFDVDPETAEMAKSIKNEPLVKERVSEEWMKLCIKGKYPGKALLYLVKTGWIDNYPQLKSMIGVLQYPPFHPEGAKVRKIIKK